MAARQIARIREISWFKNTTVVVYIEVNFGGWPTARTIFKGLRHIGNLFAMTHTIDKKTGLSAPGVAIDNVDKLCAAENLVEIMKAKRLSFVNHFVTDSKLDDFFTQMDNLEYRYKETKERWGEGMTEISGKRRGGNDDMVIALLMASIFGGVFMCDRSNEYRFPGFKARLHMTVGIEKMMKQGRRKTVEVVDEVTD